MRTNITVPGLTHVMRRGDFVNWQYGVESMENLSMFQVDVPAQVAPDVVTHVREFDHSGLRVECEDTVIRVHGLAVSLQALELALQTAEELQVMQKCSIHVDVRISPLQNLNRLRA
ncbi:MAG: hypothetical protein NT013_31080 [Planctomycetia bacterium]|nr:hypothetical protein [Planctomycetia bacterium]